MKTKQKYQSQNARKSEEKIKFETIVATNLKTIRLYNNYTQRHVCLVTGISTSYYCEVEQHHRGIGLFYLYKLARFYNLPMNWFIDYHGV